MSNPSSPSYESLVALSADVSLISTLDGVCRYASPSCEQAYGWRPADLTGCHMDDLVHPDDLGLVREARRDVADGQSLVTTYRLRCADGSYRWSEATARRVGAGPTDLVVSTLRVLAGRHQQALALQHRALTDPLTGVPNRTVLMDRMGQALRRLERGEGALAVLYLDLDRFKSINDSLGHRAGDAVLSKLAERLTHHLRPSDTLARLGGDEFVIVAEDMPPDSAHALADRIVAAGREPFRVGEADFVCTLSVGIATTLDARRGAEDLLHDADLALYRAKDKGRDRVEVFDEGVRTSVIDRRGIERTLRRALEDGRVVIEYQPIVDIRTSSVIGAEALARARGSDGALLMPRTFLEVAQHTGILVDIDQLVLSDAIARAAGWRERGAASGSLAVSVNVTARHLAEAGFYQTVTEALDGLGVPHEALVLDVTEQVLMEASNSALSTLRLVREAGVRVALDDFGTGYSSLAYLRQFPLDFVKVDTSVIDGLTRDRRQEALVSAIIGLSHALDLEVVAEGVESADQLRVLQSLGCDRAQGFLMGLPGAPEAIDDRVLAGSANREGETAVVPPSRDVEQGPRTGAARPDGA